MSPEHNSNKKAFFKAYFFTSYPVLSLLAHMPPCTRQNFLVLESK